MKVVEYIKGSGPVYIEIPREYVSSGNGDQTYSAESNYYGHSVSSFWTNGGRSTNDTDCKIHPAMRYGGNEYLFFGPLDYNVGFENIAVKDDKWVQYVRDYVNKRNPKKPFPSTVKDCFADAEAVVRVTAHWDNGRAVWSQEVLKGEVLPYTNMIFVSPEAIFTGRLNPDCKSTYSVKETRVDELYVFEKIPKSEVNFYNSVECVGGGLDSHGSIRARGVFSITGNAKFPIRDGVVVLSNNGAIYWGGLYAFDKNADLPYEQVLEILKSTK